MTKVTRPPLPTIVSWRLRIRARMYVESTNTGGTVLLEIYGGSILSAIAIDLDNYSKGAWHDLEFNVVPSGASGAVPRLRLRVSYTDKITGGSVYFGHLLVVELQQSPNVPQKVKANASYTLRLDDQGKHIYDVYSNTITVPPNSSVAFPIETAITFVNYKGSTQTLTQGSGVSLVLAGDGTTGNKTIAAYGVCTILKIATDVWMVTGNVS
jgi:hypothetical protein